MVLWDHVTTMYVFCEQLLLEQFRITPLVGI
jgi:hypothetical protein